MKERKTIRRVELIEAQKVAKEIRENLQFNQIHSPFIGFVDVLTEIDDNLEALNKTNRGDFNEVFLYHLYVLVSTAKTNRLMILPQWMNALFFIYEPLNEAPSLSSDFRLVTEQEYYDFKKNKQNVQKEAPAPQSFGEALANRLQIPQLDTSKGNARLELSKVIEGSPFMSEKEARRAYVYSMKDEDVIQEQAKLKKMNEDLSETLKLFSLDHFSVVSLQSATTEQQTLLEELVAKKGSGVNSERLKVFIEEASKPDSLILLERIRASNIKTPTVSDHALVRYLERKYPNGKELLDSIRSEILQPEVSTAILDGHGLETRSGNREFTVDDWTYVVNEQMNIATMYQKEKNVVGIGGELGGSEAA